MELYSIGDACRLLGVKAHVLRYWEQEIPLLSPRKDPAGRRVYGEGDMHILFRIRYLVQEEKLTLEGVKLRLWREMEEGDPDIRSRLRELRSETLRLYGIIRREKTGGGEFKLQAGSADDREDDQEN